MPHAVSQSLLIISAVLHDVALSTDHIVIKESLLPHEAILKCNQQQGYKLVELPTEATVTAFLGFMQSRTFAATSNIHFYHYVFSRGDGTNMDWYQAVNL